MSMSQQAETALITTGTGATWSAGALAFSLAITPVLHLVALVTSILVGVLTAWWTWKKIRIMDIKATHAAATEDIRSTASIAANAIKEQAVVTARVIDELDAKG